MVALKSKVYGHDLCTEIAPTVLELVSGVRKKLHTADYEAAESFFVSIDWKPYSKLNETERVSWTQMGCALFFWCEACVRAKKMLELRKNRIAALKRKRKQQ